MKDYPRYVTRQVIPYDPVVLARQTEELVCTRDGFFDRGWMARLRTAARLPQSPATPETTGERVHS